MTDVHSLMLFQIYEGYIDDPRNTDNAWIETVAYHFHDETGITANIDLSVRYQILIALRVFML